MKDLITYIPDLAAFRLEAIEVFKTKGTSNEHPAAKFLSKVDDALRFNTQGFPVYYNGNQSLCLVRTNYPDDLDGTVESLEVIGECIGDEYIFSRGGKTKYESVRDMTPITIDNGDGTTYDQTPSYMIGVYAR